MASIQIGFFEHFRGSNTILIVGEHQRLQELASRLRELERTSAAPLEIHALPSVELHGDVRLTAYPCRSEERLGRRSGAPDGHEFEWRVRREGWLEAAEKIEALALAATGHQYFSTLSGADEVVVMVALPAEYPETWWHVADTNAGSGPNAARGG